MFEHPRYAPCVPLLVLVATTMIPGHARAETVGRDGYIRYRNLHMPLSEAEVRKRAIDLVNRGLAATVSQSGEEITLDGATRFRSVSVLRHPIAFRTASNLMTDLSGYSHRLKVANAKDDLLRVDRVVGDPERQTATVFLHFGGMLDEDASFPLVVSFGSGNDGKWASASFAFRCDEGFVRLLVLDLALLPGSNACESILFIGLDIVTDWRGVFVSEKVFSNEVVRKLTLVAEAMVSQAVGR